METQFLRSELLLGSGSTAVLAGKKAAVFGIGGVGSYVAEALARSGIGHLLLVDDDIVCLSNLNRQLVALHSTIGMPKVSVMRDRILDINPEATVDARKCFYGPETAEQVDLSGCSYIIDCIDTVSSKLMLVERAARLGIPIISCMGAGNKLDPTAFEIADISKTSMCPLARVMRKELKKRGIYSLKVLYSRQKPLVPAIPETESASETASDTANGGGKNTQRRQIPGSVPFVPSVAGLIIAGEVIKDLLKPL